MNNVLTSKIIGLGIEVHRNLGPGLLESAYEEALAYEFTQAGLMFQRQLKLPVNYKNNSLNSNYQLDLVVENQVILELKAVERLMAIHQAQLLTYLKLSGIAVGLLINFNEVVLKQGIKRLVV